MMKQRGLAGRKGVVPCPLNPSKRCFHYRIFDQENEEVPSFFTTHKEVLHGEQHKSV